MAQRSDIAAPRIVHHVRAEIAVRKHRELPRIYAAANGLFFALELRIGLALGKDPAEHVFDGWLFGPIANDHRVVLRAVNPVIGEHAVYIEELVTAGDHQVVIPVAEGEVFTNGKRAEPGFAPRDNSGGADVIREEERDEFVALVLAPIVLAGGSVFVELAFGPDDRRVAIDKAHFRVPFEPRDGFVEKAGAITIV